MRMCTETITVLNHTIDTATGNDVYHAATISGVSWYFRSAGSPQVKGMKEGDGCTIRIPTTAQSQKTYVPPQQYTGENADSCFTLQPGDIIMRGALPTTDEPEDLVLLPNDGEETEGNGEQPATTTANEPRLSPADVMALTQEHITVTSVTDNRRTPHAPHWKVVGT